MPTRKSTDPIKDHILPFLEYCEIEKGLSNNTQRNYQQYLRLFTHWLTATNQPNLKPHELTPEHIWNYRLYLARKYKSPRGQRLSKKSQNYCQRQFETDPLSLRSATSI